jgi:nicotinate-nucleotide adenylyltransferase
MRIGLFGGTFDPVHNAHLFVAEAGRVALGLERTVFLPTRAGRHRLETPTAPVDDRVAMLRLAIAANVHFALDESDLAPDATGLTADLLPRLRPRYPGAAFSFIVGGDSLLESPWQRFDEVLDALEAFAIAPRAEHSLERIERLRATLAPARRDKIRVLPLPGLGESATLVRAQLAAGGSIRYLVPEPVFRYIGERKLYAPAGLAERSPSRPGVERRQP